MKNKKEILTLALILFSLSFIASAGISSPYWEDNPLNMNPGETKVVNFQLQNMVGGEDITVKAEITEGSNIASLQTDTFTAKAGTSENIIPVVITIPSDFDKATQKITLEVKTVEDNQQGMVSLGSGWSSSFDVIVSGEKTSSDYSIIIVLAILVLLVIFFFVWKFMKK